MNVEVADKPLAEVRADLLAVLLFDGDELPEPLAGARGAEDVQAGFKKSVVIHPELPPRALVIGLGKRADFEPERARVAAAIAARTAARLKARSLALAAPDEGEPAVAAAALVEGAILAGYRFDRFKSKPETDEDEAGEDEPARSRPRRSSR